MNKVYLTYEIERLEDECSNLRIFIWILLLCIVFLLFRQEGIHQAVHDQLEVPPAVYPWSSVQRWEWDGDRYIEQYP